MSEQIVSQESDRITLGKHNPFAPGFDRSTRTIKAPEDTPTPDSAGPQEVAAGKIEKAPDGTIVVKVEDKDTPTPTTTTEVEQGSEAGTKVDSKFNTPSTTSAEDGVAEGVPPTEEDTSPSPELDKLYYNVARQMKEDGYIPEDVEITEDIDGNTAYSLYLQGAEKRVEEQVQVRTNQALQSLKDSGINEQHLGMAMALAAGTDPALLYENTTYARYAELSTEDTPQEEKIQVIKRGLELGGLASDKAEKYISTLEIEGDDAIDAEFEDYKEKFKEKHDAYLEQEVIKANQRKQTLEAQQKANNDFFNNVIATSSINDEPLSPTQLEDIQEGLLVANQVVERGGQQFRATDFEKFLVDIQDDFKTQLYLYKIFKYRGEELEGVEAKAKDKATKDFMGKLPSEVELDKTGAHKAKQNNGKKPVSKFSFGKKLAGGL